MPRVAANGLQIEYEETGAGEPLVLVMGVGTQLVHWPDRFCEQLAAKGFRVIRFDNRDAGLSSKLDQAGVPRIGTWTVVRAILRRPAPAPYTLGDMGDDVAGVVEGLGLESAHVVGISMGGMIAQEMAIAHPGRVRTLTSIMSSTGDRYIGKPRAIRALLRRGPTDRAGAVEHSLGVYRELAGPGYPIDEQAYRERIGRAYDRCYYPAGFLRQMAAILAGESRTAALRGLSVPTLVIHGTADPLVPLAAGRATARAVPGARLHEIEGLGHGLPEGAWPEIIESIAQHVRARKEAREASSP